MHAGYGVTLAPPIPVPSRSTDHGPSGVATFAARRLDAAAWGVSAAAFAQQKPIQGFEQGTC